MTPAPRRMPLHPYSPKVPVFGGMNGCQFAGIDEEGAGADHDQHDGHLDDDDDRVHGRRFLDPDHDQDRHGDGDEDRGQVEDRGDRAAGGLHDRAGRGCQMGRKLHAHEVVQKAGEVT